MVPVSALHDADSPRISGEDAEHVRRLAEVAQWPPVTVHRPSMRVIDGMHRLHAARLRGQDEIEVRFFDGTAAEAFVLAVRLNTRHGLPLSLSDRKAAANRILASHPQWSDRLVSSITGLAAKTVAEIRRRAQAGTRTDHEPHAGAAGHAEARIGRDGRVRRLSSAEGRRKASELMREQPGLSLRQVARATGISPETVRDVRKRIIPGRAQAAGAKPNAKPGAKPDAKPDAEPGTKPDFGSALQRLKADASLRSTKTGRALLKLLEAHAMSEEHLAGIADIVPANCRNTIAQVALECAAAWWKFADRIDRPVSEGWRRWREPGDQEPEDGGSS